MNYTEFYLKKKEDLLEQENENAAKTKNQLATAENNNPENNVAFQELSATEATVDLVGSAAVGAAETITYVLDLPFMLEDALIKGGNFAFISVAEKMGFSESEVENMDSNFKNEMAEKYKYRPGKYLRENFLTYDTKTKAGEYARSIGEFAVGGVFGKGAKAVSALTKSGAISGVVKQGVTDISGSEGVGTGVGVVTNIALDMYNLKKGKINSIAQDVIPKTTKEINEVKKLQKYTKDRGMNITAAEASGNASIVKTDGQIQSSIIGNQVVDTYWANRPTELKNYISNWATEMGIVSKNKSLSQADLYEQYRKAGIALDAQSKQAWLINGGTKIKNFNFSKTQVDDMVKELNEKVSMTNASPELLKILKNNIKFIKKSNGNGQVIQNAYKVFRDTAKNGNFVDAKVMDKNFYGSLSQIMKKTLSTNDDWVKANKKMTEFMVGYSNPLTKGSMTKLYEKMKDAKFSDSPENMGTLFKALNSPTLSKKDIIKFSESINKSKVPMLLEDTISVYFNSKFNLAASERINKGLNAGTIMFDSIMKNQQTKTNFTEMMFQLAKTKNKNVKYNDIEESVKMFADGLKASGQSGKVGSSTSGNINFKERAEANLGSGIIETVRLLESANKWMKSRAFSKTSNQMAEAMVSSDGIDALLKLAATWKQKNAGVAYIRAITTGYRAVDELTN